MSYRFRRSEPIADAVRRVVREEIQAAIAASAGDAKSLAKRVHDARTCCKKIRGVLRLVRPLLGNIYRDENAYFRDAARTLSTARDAAVVLDLFDDVARNIGFDRQAIASLRASLVNRLGPPTDGENASAILAAVGASMEARLAALGAWPLDAKGFKAVREGLADTYRSGRQTMRQAFQTGDVVDWHEWRKQAKYHWYHVRLLRNIWKPVMDVRRNELDRLAELLGSEHDLTVLRESVLSVEDSGDGAASSLLAEADARCAKIRVAARPLGERLFAETPKAFTNRVRRYWKVWRDE